jgi:hypothetical protein
MLDCNSVTVHGHVPKLKIVVLIRIAQNLCMSAEANRRYISAVLYFALMAMLRRLLP